MWLQQSSAIQLSSHPAAGLYQLQQPQKLPLPHNSACSIQRVPEHQVGNQQQMEWCVTWRGSKKRWAVRQGAKRTMGERGEGAESRVAALGADVEIPRELWVSPWLSCSPPPPLFSFLWPVSKWSKPCSSCFLRSGMSSLSHNFKHLSKAEFQQTLLSFEEEASVAQMVF